ncbi:MAG: helix-turn-helix domain-containing protein [Spirosomataceae bacterium]
MSHSFLIDIPPSPFLQDFVRKYQVFRFCFDKHQTPPPKFHAPRPEQSITFYVKDLQKYSLVGHNQVVEYPRCIINGIYTVPIYRHGANDFMAIKVVLMPTAFHRLVRLPMLELANHFIDAELVWGNSIKQTIEQLQSLDNLHEMIAVIDSFLLNLVKKNTKPLLPFDKVSHYMLSAKSDYSLDWLADQSCLSKRQFIRKFQECVGTNPKTFSRIIRFDRAFRIRNQYPDTDWLEIAVAAGYHDYQHLSKEFQDFTMLVPPTFYAVETQSPERNFGLFER